MLLPNKDADSASVSTWRRHLDPASNEGQALAEAQSRVDTAWDHPRRLAARCTSESSAEADGAHLKAKLLPVVAVVLRHEVNYWKTVQSHCFNCEPRLASAFSRLQTTDIDNVINGVDIN